MLKEYGRMAARFIVQATTRKAIRYVFHSTVAGASAVTVYLLKPVVGIYAATCIGGFSGILLDYGICLLASKGAKHTDKWLLQWLGEELAPELVREPVAEPRVALAPVQAPVRAQIPVPAPQAQAVVYAYQPANAPQRAPAEIRARFKNRFNMA